MDELDIVKFVTNAETAPPKYANSIIKKECFPNIEMKNEPVLGYETGSEELGSLERCLQSIHSSVESVFIVINGQEMKSTNTKYQYLPHKRKHIIAEFFLADEKQILKAITSAVEAQRKWDETPLEHRIQIWETAADLISGEHRSELVAATMLGQGKTIYQAEIDAGAELIDFLRMNCAFLKQLANENPISVDKKTTINHYRLRGFEGFFAAITPFNFTAIGGNLAYTPALMGNGVVWKPADNAMLASWKLFNVMREAGVPNGLVNFVPADPVTFSRVITSSEFLAGINFTGSPQTFKSLWKLVAKNLHLYRNFPRLMGECGGKNYHFVHCSADLETVVSCTVRAAFEYGGQKCSACSRLYVPKLMWTQALRECLIRETKKLLVGDVLNYSTFFSAVIDNAAFHRIVKYINDATKSKTCQILTGGNYSNLRGYFIDPTIIEVNDPNDPLLKEEIFGPVLAVYVYDEDDMVNALEHVVTSTPYALTGSVFAQDQCFLKDAIKKLRMTAGNFYINDKCTGAIVGQQPFGGSMMSGTNDKPGGLFYPLRFTSMQTIKETFVPQPDIYYPYMCMSPN